MSRVLNSKNDVNNQKTKVSQMLKVFQKYIKTKDIENFVYYSHWWAGAKKYKWYMTFTPPHQWIVIDICIIFDSFFLSAYFHTFNFFSVGTVQVIAFQIVVFFSLITIGSQFFVCFVQTLLLPEVKVYYLAGCRDTNPRRCDHSHATIELYTHT